MSVYVKKADDKLCPCGAKADVVLGALNSESEIAFCESCYHNLAISMLGFEKVKERMQKNTPSSLAKKVGEITMQYQGNDINVILGLSEDLSPTLYFKETDKYVNFEWEDILNLAIKTGALFKKIPQ